MEILQPVLRGRGEVVVALPHVAAKAHRQAQRLERADSELHIAFRKTSVLHHAAERPGERQHADLIARALVWVENASWLHSLGSFA